MRTEDRAARPFPGHGDHAQHRRAAKTQTHGNRIGGQTRRKIGGAIERIQEPDVVCSGIHGVFLFFANNTMIGERPRQSLPQQLLGAAVSFGHRRLLILLLKLNLERRPKILHENRSRLPHRLHTDRFRFFQYLAIYLHAILTGALL